MGSTGPCSIMNYGTRPEDMIITDEMLDAAFRFRSVCLWDKLSDSDVFAFRLSDGETGYCCVMGNAGDNFSLGFYRGRRGFSTYLKTLNLGWLQTSVYDMFETMLTFDCINCDFVPASALDNATKKTIRKYADDAGLKIARSHGWPSFNRFQPYKMQYDITSEREARDITEALHAAIAVNGKLMAHRPESIGFDKKGNYPTPKGGKAVPYLIPAAGGTYGWSTVKLPALVQDKHAAVKFENDILTSMVKSLPVYGVLQIRLIHMPTPINGKEDGSPYFPLILMCMEADSEFLYPPVLGEKDAEENPVPILAHLAEIFRKRAKRPQRIQVEDTKTMAFLKDFCDKCGIVLTREQDLSALDDALVSLFEEFGGF